MTEGGYSRNLTYSELPADWDPANVIKEHTEDGIRYRLFGDAPEEQMSSRRSLLKGIIATTAIVAGAGVTVAGLVIGAEKIDAALDEESNPTPIMYPVTDKDADRGIWGAVETVYPNLSNDEIQAYIESGVIINETANAENRDPLVIWPGDILWLPHP